MPSDRKARGSRPRKRKNHGNQHSGQCSQAKKKRSEVQQSTVSVTPPVCDGSSSHGIALNSSTSVSATPTTSESKLRDLWFECEDEKKETVDISDNDSDVDDEEHLPHGSPLPCTLTHGMSGRLESLCFHLVAKVCEKLAFVVVCA